MSLGGECLTLLMSSTNPYVAPELAGQLHIGYFLTIWRIVDSSAKNEPFSVP